MMEIFVKFAQVIITCVAIAAGAGGVYAFHLWLNKNGHDDGRYI